MTEKTPNYCTCVDSMVTISDSGDAVCVVCRKVYKSLLPDTHVDALLKVLDAAKDTVKAHKRMKDVTGPIHRLKLALEEWEEGTDE